MSVAADIDVGILAEMGIPTDPEPPADRGLPRYKTHLNPGSIDRVREKLRAAKVDDPEDVIKTLKNTNFHLRYEDDRYSKSQNLCWCVTSTLKESCEQIIAYKDIPEGLMQLRKYFERQKCVFPMFMERHWVDLVPAFAKAKTRAGMEAILEGLIETVYDPKKGRERRVAW
jgi:hypothetical protein